MKFGFGSDSLAETSKNEIRVLTASSPGASPDRENAGHVAAIFTRPTPDYDRGCPCTFQVCHRRADLARETQCLLPLDHLLRQLQSQRCSKPNVVAGLALYVWLSCHSNPVLESSICGTKCQSLVCGHAIACRLAQFKHAFCRDVLQEMQRVQDL